MAEKTDFELQLATLICEVLNLEDVGPADIGPEQMLSDGSLGLDSIDGLEYDLPLTTGDEQTRDIFATLRNLANPITQETGAQSA